jgi:hypothetical protein
MPNILGLSGGRGFLSDGDGDGSLAGECDDASLAGDGAGANGVLRADRSGCARGNDVHRDGGDGRVPWPRESVHARGARSGGAILR